jgi:hypothetical protein
MTSVSREILAVSTSWEGELETAYEQAVSRWIGEADAPAAEAVYRTETFPLACERIRQARAGVPRLDLLFVPVGTQPYAPILAVVGNPAECVALLETPESWPHGQLVEAALGPDGSTQFLHVRIDQTDVIDIAQKMKAVFDSRGLPSAASVGADVTGGRKTMTAAVAGVGSLFGWRLFYVEGVQVRERMGYAHHERIIELANVLDVFGSRRRETALALLAAGACEAAAAELAALELTSAASLEDANLRLFARTAADLRAGRWESFRRRAPTAARRLGRRLPRQTRQLLQEPPVDSPALEAAFLWVAARVRIRERDVPAARALLARAAEILGAGPASAQERCKELAGRLAADGRMALHLPQLERLDAVFGRGVRRLAQRQP